MIQHKKTRDPRKAVIFGGWPNVNLYTSCFSENMAYGNSI